jgi:hypothetical protein
MLSEEYKLQIPESKVPRKIFGPEKDDVHEYFRMLHNEEVHNFHGLPIIVKTVKSYRL